MATDELIFAPRVSTTTRRPPQEALNAFLKNTERAGGRGPHIKDLTAYHRLLKETEAFQQRLPEEERQDLRDLMFFSVVNHTRFANPALLSEVVQYKFFLHTLASLDFKHPADFIKSAEHEMGRLNMKKINDVLRMTRLKEMIGERKKILAKLKGQWMEATAELRLIALYIRDNLVKIEKLCGASLVILAEPETGRVKEKQLIEDLKGAFKERLKNALHRGEVTKQDLDKAKKEVDELLAEMSGLVRGDIGALSELYASIRDHVKKAATDIAVLLVDLESKKGGGVDANRALFAQIEQVLVSLIADFHFELQVSPIRSAGNYHAVVTEKRKELIEYFFDQVQTERRARADRRNGRDRRKFDDPDYKGPERRNSRDRRDGMSRRRATPSS